MIENQTKKAVIYCRVSTKEQVEEGNSLATQERICRDYALKSGYDIAEVFLEQGESAKTADRTELKRLLTYCSNRKNGIKAVIAYKLDRISRSTHDYNQIRFLLKRYGIEFKSTSEYFEDTPAGRFMENIISNVAQFDNDVRTERSIGGMRDAAREGRYVWKAPVGYDNVKIGGRCTIALNTQADLVRTIFEEVAKNLAPIDEVRRRIMKAGLTTRYGKPVVRSHFYKMLKNETYCGRIVKLGERFKGTYEPLVSEELFEQVQRVLRQRHKRCRQYEIENPDFPLRRFIHHPSGYKLRGGWCTGRSKRYPYYFFGIKGVTARKQDLEQAFREFLNRFRLSAHDYDPLRKKVWENLDKAMEDNQTTERRLEAQISDLRDKQSHLIGKNLQGIVPDHILKQQIENIEVEITKTYSLLYALPKQSKNNQQLLDLVKEYLLSPGEVWQKAAFPAKKKLQWFYFPQGLAFDGKKFRTTEICKLFNVKEVFLDPKSTKVPLGVTHLNRLKSLTKEDWQKIGLELQALFEIMQV